MSREFGNLCKCEYNLIELNYRECNTRSVQVLHVNLICDSRIFSGKINEFSVWRNVLRGLINDQFVLPHCPFFCVFFCQPLVYTRMSNIFGVGVRDFFEFSRCSSNRSNSPSSSTDFFSDNFQF